MAIAQLFLKVVGSMAGLKSDTDKMAVAVEKMGASFDGAAVKVTRAKDAMASSSDKLRGKVGSVQTSFRSFNDVLESVGINIRDQVGAIDQLQGAAGKTAGELGGLATAGFAVGAAFAGWGIGRKIAELTGSDEAIGRLTAKLFGLGDAAAEAAGAKMDVLTRASQNAGRQITDLTEAIKINFEATQRATDAVSRSNAFDGLARDVGKWRGELDALRSSGVLDNLRDNLLSQTHSTKALAERYRISSEAIQLFSRETNAAKVASDKAKAASEAHARAIQNITDKLTGAGAIQAARDMTEALRGLPSVTKLSDDALKNVNTTMREALDVFERQGRVAPEAMRLLYIESTRLPAVIDGIGESVRSLGTEFDIVIPKLQTLTDLIGEVTSGLPGQMGTEVGVPTIPTLPKNLFQNIFGDSKQFGQQLASTILGAVQGAGDAFSAVGSLIGSKLGTSMGSKLAGFFTGPGAGIFSQALGGMFNAVLPGIGALMGPLLEKIGGAVAGIFDRNKGRDLIKDFAASFGGFDALHRKLQETFDDATAEQWWIRLTQSIGRNDQEGARAAIAAVNAAFDTHVETLREAGDAASRFGELESAALQDAQDALKGIDSKLEGLRAAVAIEMPEAITKSNPFGMGVVERQQRQQIAMLEEAQRHAQLRLKELAAQAGAEMEGVLNRLPDVVDIRVRWRVDDLELPGGVTLPGWSVPHFAHGGVVTQPTLLIAGDRGPEAIVPLSGQQLGITGGYQTIVVEIDGDTVARASLKYAPGLFRIHGVH